MPTEKPTPKGALNTEPATTIGGSITAVLIALFAVLRAFGVGITDDMSEGLTALVLALCAIPAVSGFLTRFFVVSPETAVKATNQSAKTGNAIDPMQPDSWGDASPRRG